VSNGRRFWLPTQKGTELFPNVTQQPTKLVIEGVPTGTPLFRVVAAHFAGQLKQFHSKAQQAYALSTTNQMRRHIEMTGAQATYLNQYGQETLTLQVDRSVLEELKQHAGEPWDWAIINFKVLDPPSDAIFAAYQIAPLLQTLTPDLTEARGVSYYPGGDNGLGDKPMSFPNPTHFTALAPLSVDAGYTAGSLCVDLKTAHSEGEVLIDVYGKITGARMCFNQVKRLPLTYTMTYPTSPPPSSSAAPPVTAGWHLRGNLLFRLPDCSTVQVYFYLGTLNSVWAARTDFATLSTTSRIDITEDTFTDVTFTATPTASLITVTVTASNDLVTIFGDWNPVFNDVSFEQSANGRTADGWWNYTVVGADGVGGWTTGVFTASETIAYSNPGQSGSPPATDGESWTPLDGQLSYNIYFVGSLEHTAAPTLDDAETITCDMVVAGLVGKGEPDWVYSTHTSDFAFNAWELRAVYPDPVPTAVINDTATISTTTDPDSTLIDHYGLPYLGRLNINRKFGSIGFTPSTT
jgi:hypothetical protein